MKRFKDEACARDQLMLLAPSLDETISQRHEVRVFDEIMSLLDLAGFGSAYRGGGAPAYDPQMMVRAVLYGVWRGVRSSRELARQLDENLAFRWLCQMQHPSYATIARFMQRHREQLSPLFVQTVGLARELKLVSLSHVSVDGTAIEANVSGKSTYSKERLEKTLGHVNEQIQEHIRVWLERDAQEEAEWGERRGDELPADLTTLKARKARLEELQKEREEIQRNSIAATDPQSRMMRVRGAVRPAYNAQAAVDAANQVIVAAEVICQQTDNAALPSVVDQVSANTGQSPQTVLADAGYSGPALVRCAQEHPQTEFYVAQQGRKTDRRDHFTYDADRDIMLDENGREHFFYTEQERHGTRYRIYRARGTPKSQIWEPQNGDFNKKMRDKLATSDGKAIYNLRRQTVEPVFGFMKTRMGMRRFHRRGLIGVRIEFMLACIAHNLGKIARYGSMKTAQSAV